MDTSPPALTEQLSFPVVATAIGGNGAVLLADGSLWQVTNLNGPWSEPLTLEEFTPPAPVASLTTGYLGAAILDDGTVWTLPAFGTEPTIVPGMGSTRSASRGAQHVVALDQQGRIWTWGNNEYGQLGDGTQSSHWYAAVEIRLR